jgi:hypothetical protein
MDDGWRGQLNQRHTGRPTTGSWIQTVGFDGSREGRAICSGSVGTIRAELGSSPGAADLRGLYLTPHPFFHLIAWRTVFIRCREASVLLIRGSRVKG